MLNPSKIMKNKDRFFWVGIAGLELLLVGTSQAAAVAPFNQISIQGVIRQSPTAYVADGSYCAQVTLTIPGAATWSTQFGAFQVTSGTFNETLSGVGTISGTDLGSELLTATGYPTAEVKIDYVHACTYVAGTFDDFTPLSVQSVPYAMLSGGLATLANGGTALVGDNFSATGIPLSAFDTNGAAGTVLTSPGGSGTPTWSAPNNTFTGITSNSASPISLNGTAGNSGNVTIGNTTGAETTTIAGTTTVINGPTLNLDTGASAAAIGIGNTTGTTGVTIKSGSGGVNITGATTMTGGNSISGALFVGSGATVLGGASVDTLTAGTSITDSGFLSAGATTLTGLSASGGNTLTGGTSITGALFTGTLNTIAGTSTSITGILAASGGNTLTGGTSITGALFTGTNNVLAGTATTVSGILNSTGGSTLTGGTSLTGALFSAALFTDAATNTTLGGTATTVSGILDSTGGSTLTGGTKLGTNGTAIANGIVKCTNITTVTVSGISPEAIELVGAAQCVGATAGNAVYCSLTTVPAVTGRVLPASMAIVTAGEVELFYNNMAAVTYTPAALSYSCWTIQ